MITKITKDPVRERSTDLGQFIEDKITSRANKVIGVTHTAYGQIQDVMAQGVKDGSTHYEIGQQIESKLDELWETRGETISKTEVNSAMNGQCWRTREQ